MRRLLVCTGVGVALSFVASVVDAQEYRRPACDIPRGHFLVSQAETYIKGGSEESDPAERAQLFTDAIRTLREALDRGEVENSAVWYLLARTYFELDDAVGVDSAFARAVRLQPDCEDDALYYRDLMWVPLINSAVDSLQSGAFEGAKDLLRKASALKPTDNIGFYYLARIFASEGETDSAFHYLKQVADMEPIDSTREANQIEAIHTIGQLHHGLMDWDSSIVWNERRQEIDPENPEVLTTLAEAYGNVGNVERANELYSEVFSNAENFTSDQLFAAGEQLYLAEQFELAARAFDLGLEKNPYSRQGLYNLVNSHRSIAQDDRASDGERSAAASRMTEAAIRLVEVDPQSSESLGLLAAAYQVQLNEAETDRIVARMNALTFEIEVFFAEMANGIYTVQGRIRNLTDSAAEIPEVTFEFLGSGGDVVGTDTAGGDTIAAKDALNFAVMGQGDIIAYRYKTN